MFSSVFIIKAVTVPLCRLYRLSVHHVHGRVATSYGFKERTILYTTVLASTVYRVKRVRLRLLYRATALPLAARLPRVNLKP